MTSLNGANALRALFQVRFAGLIALLGLLGLLSGCASTGGDAAPSGSFDVAEVEGTAEVIDTKDAVPKVESKSKYGNPKSYVVHGKRYYTKTNADGHVEKGLASWYGKKFHGRKTSSGERYNMYAMTAAHKSLPLPSYVKVTNVKNGRSAVVKVNDRGPFHGKRVIDLSYAAARKIGVIKHGTAMVEVRAIDPRKPNSDDNAENLFADAGRPEKPKSVKKTAPVVAKRATAPTKAPSIQVASVSAATKTETQSASKQQARPVVGSETLMATLAPMRQSTTKPSTASPVYLQVGAFGSRTNAEQLRRQLVDQLEETVLVRTADGTKAPLYKVHVGPLDSRGEANDVSQKLAALGLPKALVIEE